MASFTETVVATLAEAVGPVPAQMFIHSVAVKMGKSTEQLTSSDIDAVCEHLRTDMSPFASSALIESAISRLREAI